MFITLETDNAGQKMPAALIKRKKILPSSVTSEPLSGMALCLAALIMGIVATAPEAESHRLALVLISAATVLMIAALTRPSESIQPAPVFWMILSGLLLGIFTTLHHEKSLPVMVTEEALPPHRQSMVLEGILKDRINRPDSVRLILSDTDFPGMIQLTAYGQKRHAVTAMPGDRIRLSARLRSPKNYRVPGGFDYLRYLRQRHIVATGYLTDDKPLEILNSGEQYSLWSWPLWSWNRLREELSQRIARHLPFEQVGLVEALLVGKRGMLDRTTKEAFQTTGLFHLIAISGLHLGLVAGWSFWILRRALVLCLPISRRWDMKSPAALLTLIPLWCYGALAGWSLPTQRAVIMVSVFLAAIFVKRQNQSGRALMLAAILLLIGHPSYLFSAGFQLSFLAVAGLIMALPKRDFGFHGWRRRLMALVTATLVAALATAPLVAHHFHQISPYGFFANLMALPIVGMISTPLGLLSLIFQPISDSVSLLFLETMGKSLSLVREIAVIISELPGAWQRLPGPTFPGLALATAALLLYGGMPQRFNDRHGVLFLTVATGALLWPRSEPPAHLFHAAILDVGQAQSIVTRAPGGGWSVFDAGGSVTPRFQIGEAVISAYLWHHGVTTLERVVVSHPQSDHMAGAEQLLRNFQVHALWIGEFPKAEKNNASYRSLITTARARAVPVRRMHAATTPTTIQDGTMRLTVLYPPQKTERVRLTTNDRSLVLLLQTGESRLLIPGDLERRGEKLFLAETERALSPITVVVAPHHGSKTSSSNELVHLLRPEHVVFSVGHRNRYRFPNQSVVDRWRSVGAQIWRTDQHGTITITSDGITTTLSAYSRQ